jgi:vancomycin permeability regulator SanA
VQTPAKSPLAREALRFGGAAVGLFIVANLAGEIVRPPFDTLPDWLTAPHTRWLRLPLDALLAAFLFAGALRVLDARPVLRRAALLLAGALVAVALFDAARFYAALVRGAILTPALVPASLLVALFFAAWLADLRWPLPSPPPSRALFLTRATAACLILAGLPAVRMFTFGPTRYERRADCAVVFGARVWDDGRPSEALADRVDTAVGLYHQGRVSRLVMSGGIDPKNGYSEPEVMRARAEKAGVPREAVLLDEEGIDTASSVRNVAQLLRAEKLRTALVVSHYYHEPRAKMLFDRAGVKAWTVPAIMHRRLLKEPYYLVREVAAFWNSFLRE